MQFRFLLGAAGTGKTFRCLDEIRSELRARPEGPPLVFVAPKQSTYQLERQLLDLDGLRGYSRLQILSFERLARFVFAELRRPVPIFLSDQGRTMVLRALLTRHADELTLFRNAARHAGFAEELSRQVREFQSHGLEPAAVRELARQMGDSRKRTSEKLSDLALLYEKYVSWLRATSLDDGDALLSAAADLMARNAPLRISGLWLDGFAQLTPAESRLLTAVLRFTDRATLAFCLDPQAGAETSISSWFLVNRTYQKCRAAVEQIRGRETVAVEHLERDSNVGGRSRFARAAALRHLERHWGTATPLAGPTDGVRIVQAADPEAEAVFVAREIIKFVRAGGRYRETALLLRSLQNDYPQVLRRVFTRYDIPFFLDHRESVAHHQIAELTRGALRTIAFDWKHQDWFATLKCGLMRIGHDELDTLENEALARGWNGAAWREDFSVPGEAARERELNLLRVRAVTPFTTLERNLGPRPSAEALAAGIRRLWEELAVEGQLESWTQEEPGSALHATVWDQMDLWLEDLTLAFSGHKLPASQWLPILEAGLRNLTVGIVPPVLDQVLIGSVDRSRNPDLKLVFVLGVNERVFPAAPVRDTLLGEEDRSALMDLGCTLSDIPVERAAAEQFYGYIACTRARERVVLTFARNGADGAQLNPSRFISQLGRLFPAVEIESFQPPKDPEELVHPCEMAAAGIPRTVAGGKLELSAPDQNETLDREVVQRLYGTKLEVAVSSLERFAACPFQFFVRHGLRVDERKEFRLDIREQGSFQHEVLAQFHYELVEEGLKWRDLTPDAARERIGRIADALTGTFRDGLLAATEQNRYTARTYKRSLQEFIAVIIEWFETNRFDPERVEFAFGKASPLPGCRVPLKDGRALILHGRLDRIDLLRTSETEGSCVIFDYKSGLQKPDRVLLHHGVQQQLPGYLLAMTRVSGIAEYFGVKTLSPAGCFLIPLGAKYERGRTRRKALGEARNARRSAYMHGGIFDFQYLEFLDGSAPEEMSGQFDFRLRKDGRPYRGSFNALESDGFQAVLARTEELMREFGDRIYAGDIAIHPYKKGKETACESCHFQPICRFDSWTQPHRVLRRPEKQTPQSGEEE